LGHKELYDVEAKPPESDQSNSWNVRYTWWRIEDERLRQMLQALLLERFHLKFVRENSTGPIYLLQKSGKALLLRPTKAGSAASPEISAEAIGLGVSTIRR
jgi:uncharacterized protein (TIGR03435 family)